MKEDIYFRVNCFYYYALSNSLYLIFYLLPYVSQITNQVFYLWIILKTRPSQISFRLSYSPIFSIIHFLIIIVEFFNCSDDKHPLNIGLKLNFLLTSQNMSTKPRKPEWPSAYSWYHHPKCQSLFLLLCALKFVIFDFLFAPICLSNYKSSILSMNYPQNTTFTDLF